MSKVAQTLVFMAFFDQAEYAVYVCLDSRDTRLDGYNCVLQTIEGWLQSQYLVNTQTSGRRAPIAVIP